MLVEEIDRFVARRRALHREVQFELRVLAARVAHQAGVGEDDRVRMDAFRALEGLGPARPVRRLRIGVDRDDDPALAPMRVGDSFRQRCVVEIQAGEIARVGVVAQPRVDPVGALVDCGLERRQAAGWAHQLDAGGSRQPSLLDKAKILERCCIEHLMHIKPRVSGWYPVSGEGRI